jgi:alkaline phosphatase/streptomycin-6-phosphatase
LAAHENHDAYDPGHVRNGATAWLRSRRSRQLAAASLFCALLLAGCGISLRPPEPAPADRSGTGQVPQAPMDRRAARNVVLLVGDGLDDSAITIARNYHVGAAGRLHLDTLPATGTCTVYAVEETDPSRPVYVADSAASATALLAGRKTSNRRISTAAGNDEHLPTILEAAQRDGLRTGIVTTSDLTDATPAAAAAHVNSRWCRGPEEMHPCPAYRKSAGGPGSIAEQLIDRRVDLLFGGGRKRFEQRIDGGPHRGNTVLQSAKTQGYAVVDTTEDLAAIDNGDHLLGLFAEEHLHPAWTGEPATPHPGSGPQRCSVNPAAHAQPTLANLTREAIQHLEAPGSSKGFFLLVEGALIDKCAHRADVCGQIGETIAFDEAVGVALNYARARDDTLIIVTGDHAHTSQIIPPPSDLMRSPGLVTTLHTAEGATMTVNYATNAKRTYQLHTGSQVRIAAAGPQAANIVGVVDQTDVYRLIASALGLTVDPLQDQRKSDD